jgi:hypothetical protein
MMSKNSIPPIKFKTFLNHWSYTELKEIKDVRDGTHSSPKYIDNGYPLVTSKNLTDSGLNLNDVSLISESDYDEINKRSKVEVGDILLGLIGTIGKPVLVDSDGFAIKNVGLIKNGGEIQNQFLLQYLKTNLFNKYIQIEMAGNTQKFLGLETLRNTKVPVPSQDEQFAIGSLFRTLDELLSSYKDNLANYQSLKTTMLSKMFPKAGETVPEIRLDGFEGEWEIKRADEIFKSVSEKNKALLPVLSASQIDGMVLRDELGIDIKYDEATLNNYKVVKPGQFVIHLRSFQGGFALSKIEGITSPAYTIIDFIDKENSLPAFWNSILTSRDFIKRLETVTYGIRDGKSISFKDFSSLKFVFPEFKEQQAIGSYFSILDNLINSHQEKISQLETLKKKLLQDMFI